MSFVFFFFFSSRRRHTRYIGDWSSDVCSSDLVEELGRAVREQGGAAGALTVPDTIQEVLLGRIGRLAPEDKRRSEERRVGKECRTGGRAAEEHENKRATSKKMNRREVGMAK